MFAEVMLKDKSPVLTISVAVVLPILWESDDPVTHVLDGFYVPDSELDADGFFFFDSETHPIVFDYYFFILPKTNDLFGAWPFFDINFSATNARIELNSIYARNTRLRRAWHTEFGLTRYVLRNLSCPTTPVYFITFRLVGIGYYCECLNNTSIRLIVSNTHDVILTTPTTLFVGLPKVDNASEPTLFFIYGQDYRLLQAFAAKLHALVPFNVYEYKGVLFDGEKRRKRVTKQKQK